MLAPYNFSVTDLVWIYEQGKSNIEETCDTKILQGKLSMPNVGICDDSVLTLVIVCLVTFVVQFLRHWLWDLTSVAQYNILSKEQGKRDFAGIIAFSCIQLGKSLLWVISLLIVVNANIAVILTHIISDFISCAYWIWATRRFNKMPLDTDRIIEAIEKNPEQWGEFIKAKRKLYEFNKINDKLAPELKIDAGKKSKIQNEEIFSNSQEVGQPNLTKRHTLTF